MIPPLPLTELPKQTLPRLDNPYQALIEVLELAEPLARDCGTQILVALPAHLPALGLGVEAFRRLLIGELAAVLELSCGEFDNLQVRLGVGTVEFEARSISDRKDHRIDALKLAALRLGVKAVMGEVEDTSTPSAPALCMRLPVAL